MTYETNIEKYRIKQEGKKMKEWLPKINAESCIAHYGNMQQLGGIRRCILQDGKAAGVEAACVRTGGGLTFTVLPGRGMDIADCTYRGVPISYISKTGICGPAYYDSHENNWLKNFFAGMLTTCGISNAGPECRDFHPIAGELQYGLHGDISNTGADQVGIWEDWTPEGYRMEVTGRISEGRLHGEHLRLRRKVTALLGEKRFFVTDEFRNEGNLPEPLMFFYHINIGHPILDEGSRFLSASKKVWAVTDVAKTGLSEYDLCHGPKENVIEQQFFHDLYTNEEGKTVLALVNENLELGFYLKYSPSQLPCVSQWKVGREGEYVFAFEPGNCYPIGREEQRKRGKLEILRPMETHLVEMEFGIVDGLEEIHELRKNITGLKCTLC